METPTKSALNKMKVAELRGQLTEFGLPTNGIKADLVQVGDQWMYTFNINRTNIYAKQSH